LHFDATTAVLLALLGFGVGAFGTVVGAGGGFILTPILLLLYPHDSARTLTAISLTVVFFNASSGTVAYARQRRTDFRSGAVFALATLPGAVGGALVVGAVSRHVFDGLMGGMLALLAVWLLSGERWLPKPARRHVVRRLLTDRQGLLYEYDVPLLRGAAYSLVVGFVSSFLGIGGGVIHVPLLVRALGFPTHIATATSHFVLAVMSGVGALTHVVTGSFAHGEGIRRTVALSVGVVAGAQAGAHLSLRLRGRVIELLLAVALVGLAVRLLVAAR
jgi:uncharacterized membrane protein YfcA